MQDIDHVVFAKVRTCFADALGLDEDEVLFESKIIDELGAESLDFLDVVFRLERAFSIKIPRGGIEKAAKDGVGGDDYELNGVLTPLALAKLAEAMPEVPAEEFKPGLRTAEVPSLFRVGTFYRMVVGLMAEQGATAARAASRAESASVAAEI
jgi:acyl carrier protein